jgi:hypothetical protein
MSMLQVSKVSNPRLCPPKGTSRKLKKMKEEYSDSDTDFEENEDFDTELMCRPVKPDLSRPPGDCPDCGTWGRIKYIGDKTKGRACIACLCFGVIGLCVLNCPQDEKVSVGA